MKGPSRASVDSMAYSSEGSPPDTARAAGGAGTAAVAEVAEGAAAAAASEIPVSVLAWLNDDSAGSSDEEPPLRSRRGSRCAAGTTHQQQNRASCTRGSALARTSSSLDKRGAAVAARTAAKAAAAAAAAKIAAGIESGAALSSGSYSADAASVAVEKKKLTLDVALIHGRSADVRQQLDLAGDQQLSGVPAASCCSAGSRSSAGLSETVQQKGLCAKQHQRPAPVTSSAAISAAASCCDAAAFNAAAAAAPAAAGLEGRAQRSSVEVDGHIPATAAAQVAVGADIGGVETESGMRKEEDRPRGSSSGNRSNGSTRCGSLGWNATENEMQRWLSLGSDEDEEAEGGEEEEKGRCCGERGERSGSGNAQTAPVSRPVEAGSEPR